MHVARAGARRAALPLHDAAHADRQRAASRSATRPPSNTSAASKRRRRRRASARRSRRRSPPRRPTATRHVARQLARAREVDQRREQAVEVALVVRRAARVDVAVAHLGLERRRVPGLERCDRLHVVVPVDQQVRRAGDGRSGCVPTASGLRCRLEDLGAAAGVADALADPLGCALAGRRARRRRTRWTGCGGTRRARRAARQSCGAPGYSPDSARPPPGPRVDRMERRRRYRAGRRRRRRRRAAARSLPRRRRDALARRLGSAARTSARASEAVLPLVLAALHALRADGERPALSVLVDDDDAARELAEADRRLPARRAGRLPAAPRRGLGLGARSRRRTSSASARGRSTCSPPAASWPSRPRRWSSAIGARDARPRRCGSRVGDEIERDELLERARRGRLRARRRTVDERGQVAGPRRRRRRVPDDRPRADAHRAVRRRGRARLGLLVAHPALAARPRAACASTRRRSSLEPSTRRVVRRRRRPRVPPGLVRWRPSCSPPARSSPGSRGAWPRRAARAAAEVAHLPGRPPAAATYGSADARELVDARARARPAAAGPAGRVRGPAPGARRRAAWPRPRTSCARWCAPACGCWSRSRTAATPSAPLAAAAPRRGAACSRPATPLPRPPGVCFGRLAAAPRLRRDASSRLAVLPSTQLFRRREAPTGRAASAAPSRAFTDLRPGDYVVHEDHGVGRFVGFDTKTVAGVTRDYLEPRLQRRGQAVRAARADRQGVALHRRRRPRAGALEARRQGLAHAEGARARTPCTSWRASCSRCTPRARRAPRQPIERRRRAGSTRARGARSRTPRPTTRRARSRPSRPTSSRTRPMDRLICGDVGFGKTEVAMRAAVQGREPAAARC